ncbi:MAG: DUF1003 domain-containing protein [Acidobacteria bacterium]|nr:DUF1003 domain-containing protein [Acidobacteriota bacterium]
MRRPIDERVVSFPDQGRGEAQAVSKTLTLLKPSRAERVINSTVKLIGSRAFIDFNILWIGSWIIVNTELVPGLPPFDPFPFGLLLLILPSEALFLIILVRFNYMQHSRQMARIESLFDTLYQDGDAAGDTCTADDAVCPPNPEREI